MNVKLETFVNTLALLAITEESFAVELDAARIDLGNHDFFGAKVYLKFQELLKEFSWKTARDELRHDLDILEKVSVPFTEIPRNYWSLSEKYGYLKRAHDFENLAGLLRDFPEKGREILDSFSSEVPQVINHADVFDLASVYADELYIDATTGKSVVEIPNMGMLSKLIGGFNPERIGLLIAQTGFGKSNFSLNLALNAALKMRVAYINMEMGFKDISRRALAIKSDVSIADIHRGQFTPRMLSSSFSDVRGRLSITGGQPASVSQIRAWIKTQEKSGPFELVIIDYDQKIELATSRDMPEWKALQKAIEELEQLAKEGKFYVLVLAQGNREGGISGSFRSQFPAHTVMHFHDHSVHGPIVSLVKTRHSRRGRAVKFSYSKENLRIIESEIFDFDPDRVEKKENKKHHIPLWEKFAPGGPPIEF